MRAGPRMQVVLPNALSNCANNCDWIHGRGEVSSQCHISATKGSTIVYRLMNDGQMFFFPLDVFAPTLLCSPQLNIWISWQGGGEGLGLIHECPACTLSQMEMGLKLLVADYLYNLSRPFMPPSLQHCPYSVGGMCSTRIQEATRCVEATSSFSPAEAELCSCTELHQAPSCHDLPRHQLPTIGAVPAAFKQMSCSWM